MRLAFGCAVSDFGKVTVSTPFSKVASTLSHQLAQDAFKRP